MIFDIVVLAALAISAIIAFFRGFIREALTIVGVLGGAAAAYYGGPHLAPVVRGWFGLDGNEEEIGSFLDIVPYTYLSDGLTYAGIFIVVMIALSISAHILSKSAEAVGMGALDRTFGVIFGLLRAVLLIGLLYLPVYVGVKQEQRDEWFEGSRTIVYVDMIAKQMKALFPEDTEEKMEEALEGKAKEIGEKTRERLKEMDILGGNKNDDNQSEPDQEESGGYNEEEIKTLDDLIQDKLQQNE